MSDSESQSAQEFNLQFVAEEQQPHIKEILQKGKKILPSYDEATLYALFKRYYSVDNIFYNELNIIARRSRGDFDTQGQKRKDQHWINVGRKVRTQVNKTKYNFLQDKQLIRRAQQYQKNKKLLPQRRQNFGPNRQNDNRQGGSYIRDNNNRAPYSNNRSYQDNRPKQKFVQKVEDKPQTKVQQKATQQVRKPVETVKVDGKQLKYKEKIQTAANQQTTAPVKTQHSAVKQQQKKLASKNTQNHKNQQNKHSEPVKKQQKKVVQQAKKQESAKKPQQSKKQEHIKKPQVAEKPKFVQKVEKPIQPVAVEKKQPVQTTKPVSQPVTQTVSHAPKQTSSIPSTHSIPTVQNFNPTLAGQNFDQACNQNSFVLKFIQPQAYPQRISYVRTSDGAMKNVQIRVTGTSNSGSQKGI